MGAELEEDEHKQPSGCVTAVRPRSLFTPVV